MKKRIPSGVRRSRGFSLTELLAVIIIMSVLAAIVIPGMGGLLGQTKLKSAIAPLVSTLRQAQQYAITHGHPVYVVFPTKRDEATLYGTNGELRKRFLRGYAVYSARDKYLGEWQHLPEGVVFNATYDTSAYRNNVLSEAGFDQTVSVQKAANINTIETAQKLRAITFYPDGTVKSSDSAPNAAFIVVSYGVTNAANTEETAMSVEVYDNKPSVILEINPLTGSVKVHEEYSDAP